MTKKPTYEELEQRIKELENEAAKHRQAEEALHETEHKYQHLTESLLDIVYEFDREGKFTYVNEAGTHMFGYSKEEILHGLRVQDTMAEKDRDLSQRTIGEIFKGNTTAGERTFLRKDGRQFIGEIHSGPIYKGEEVVGVRGVLRDITASKQAEEALRESELKFRGLFDLSPQAIAVTEAETGILIDVNDAFCRLTKYNKEEVLGKTTTELGFYSKEDRNRFIGKLQPSGEIHGFEMDFKAKDGFILNSMMFARHIQLKGKIFIITAFLNMTERKRLEAQLQRAQKMEAIGTLAGGVAHDLNNILSGLVSYPDLLLMQLPEDSPLRKPIVTMQESGLRAAAIVQDLLTLARRGVPTMEVVDLNEIITEYLKSPECEKLRSFNPHVAIEPDLKGDLLNISGSRVHLAKTVMNLVSNAAEAMKEGGTIFLSTENRYIDRPIRGSDQVEEGDYVILSVCDTGVGIPPEDIDRIFEPFYTKKKIGRSGTGLGMAVVWGTVKDHKGYIDVQSSEGKGTTFTLYFPATRQGRAKEKPLVSIEDYRGKGESILVVDDVREQRDIASTILSELGYSVSAVSSGEEAVEYLKDRSVDLLILDMIMYPGIDGLDTYREILELHPHQKAIIASGFSETKRVKEAQRLGAATYIKKPYTLEKIGLAVKGELEE